ncbi:hypothetical protein [Pararobbsia silviterrae]|uniref:Dodecin domain-containing protein n=1 Tax=Pararobbsia silviterrae TaxID=1792498 RepID=A0A494X8L7_9BURK|nr:hypothetical protein [Pararobbsia silviterrae]RKP44726.1 hypothetical protein D7S86_27270 [Pararobbsia silviterrae]
MSTTVRIVAEVELTVDTWGDKGNTDALAQQAVREGITKLRGMNRDLHLIKINEVKFVVHGVKWGTSEIKT